MNRKSPNGQKHKLSPSVVCSTTDTEDEMVPVKKEVKKRTPAKKTPIQKKSESQGSTNVVPPTKLITKTPGMCILFMPRRVDFSSAMIDYDACSTLSAFASVYWA